MVVMKNKSAFGNFTKSVRNVGDMLGPFFVYYLVYLLAAVGLTSWVIDILRGAGQNWSNFLLEQEATVNAVIGGFAMLLGIVPLIPAFRRETSGQEVKKEKGQWQRVLITITLAIASSLAINIAFTQTHLIEKSETYNRVSDSQYGVVFLFGLFLYGIVSPLAEEVVFRGIIYHRMKKYYPVMAAVFLSALLFGLYHGNLVQGIYGFLMGSLIAYCYEKYHQFFYAFLFHAAANAVVYTVTSWPDLYGLVMRPYCGIVFAVISFGLLLYMGRKK